MKKLLFVIILILLPLTLMAQFEPPNYWAKTNDTIYPKPKYVLAIPYTSTLFQSINTWLGDNYFNKIFADTLIVNMIDLDTSLSLTTLSGKRFVYFSAIDSTAKFYNDNGAFLTINTKDSSFVTTGDITADDIYGDTLYITKIVGFDPVDTTRLFFLDKDNTSAYDIQIKNITSTRLATVDSLSVTNLMSNIIPITDKTLDVGSSTKYVRSIYVDTVYAGSKISIVNALDWIVGTNGTDRWKIDSDGHFYPLASYNFGSTTKGVDSIFANNLNVSRGAIVDSLEVVSQIKGSTTIRDTNSFDGNATADTVAVTGAEISDLYFIQTMGQTVDVEDYCVVEPTATGFIVRRKSGTNENLRYSWFRIK